MRPGFENLVTDWAEFENLIASICGTGSAAVERDLMLIGKSGARRQIDVVIRTTLGLVNHLVLVECKHWKRHVTREHLDTLAVAVTDLNASKAIAFSTRGFSKGALAFAKHCGIDLFKVRDLRASEVFGPNTPLTTYRHYLWRSLRNLHFPGTYCWERDLSNSNIYMVLGGPNQTQTSVLNAEYNSRTLEGIIDSWSGEVATDLALKARVILFDGAGGVRRFWWTVKHTPDDPIRVPVDGAVAVIPRFEYDLGITLWQEHREVSLYDFHFVLAVEDCLRGVVHKASRERGSDATDITETVARKSMEDGDPLRCTQHVALLPEWVDFDFDRMQKGEYYDEPGYPAFVPESAVEWRRFE